MAIITVTHIMRKAAPYFSLATIRRQVSEDSQEKSKVVSAEEQGKVLRETENGKEKGFWFFLYFNFKLTCF